MFHNLPIELQRKIYEYDNTYREYFSQHVLPEIQANYWTKLFYRLTRGVVNFLNEEWENVSDFSDDDEEDDYQNLLVVSEMISFL